MTLLMGVGGWVGWWVGGWVGWWVGGWVGGGEAKRWVGLDGYIV